MTALAPIIAAVRTLGAAEVRIAIMPAGHASIDIQVITAAQAIDLADRLGMPEPKLVHSDRSQWWVSERGEYGFERVSIVGGHRSLCTCGGGGGS